MTTANDEHHQGSEDKGEGEGEGDGESKQHVEDSAAAQSADSPAPGALRTARAEHR